MRPTRSIPLLAALLAACSGGTDEPPAPARFTPYVPPAITPYVDAPFLQELNHTTPEVQPALRRLAGVVMAGGRAVAVTTRGLAHADSATVTATIPARDADLIAAAATGATVWVAGRHKHYAAGANLAPIERPAVTGTITGIVAGTGRAYLLLERGIAWDGGGMTLGVDRTASVSAALEANGRLYLGARDTVTAFVPPAPGASQLDAPLWTLTASIGVVRAMVAGVTLPRAIDLVVIGDRGLAAYALDGAAPRRLDVPELARYPLPNPRAAVRASDGGFIVTTSGGAYRIMERGIGPEWRVYGAERWMPSEDVRGVATDPQVADGPIWFATPEGLGVVTAKRMTLEQKLAPFVTRVVQRHDRDGAVADSHLPRRGDLSSNIPWDSDNDGSWTSYWLLAECYRWKVTGAADAKSNFDRSLEAMLRLRDLTGTDHFLARAVIRKAGCMLDDCDDPDDGKWYTSPDGEWWVKRDTSNDEVIAHVFMMGPAYDLCADDSQKQRIAAHVAGIIGGIMDRGWQLIDPVTNQVTTYGQWDPQYVNESIPGALADGGVRAVEILAGLTLAHYMTGEQRFLDGKNTLMSMYHYDDNAQGEADYGARGGDGCSDEMSTQAWFTILRYEPDPQLRARWADGWSRTWKQLGVQQGAWWDTVHAIVGGADAEMGRTARWLRLAPVDMIRWSMHNSHRLDLVRAPEPYNRADRARSDGQIIPYDERRTDRWNTNQFKVDGGFGGTVEMDGADVLAPYWAARWYGFITKP